MVNKLNRFPVLFDISPSGGATVPFENAFFVVTPLSATFLISCSDRVIFPLSALSLSSDDSLWPAVSQSAPASVWVELCRVQTWGCSWLGPAKALFHKGFFQRKIYLYRKRIPHHVVQYIEHIYRIVRTVLYTFICGIVSAFCRVHGRLFRLLQKHHRAVTLFLIEQIPGTLTQLISIWFDSFMPSTQWTHTIQLRV